MFSGSGLVQPYGSIRLTKSIREPVAFRGAQFQVGPSTAVARKTGRTSDSKRSGSEVCYHPDKWGAVHICNLYTYRVMPEEMAGLIAHFKLIGRQFADVMRMKNDPDADVYPNRRAPVLVTQDGQPVMRTDMLWGFPPYGGRGPYATNYRTLNNHMWRDWLDREHPCVVPATAFAEPDRNTAKPVI